MDTPENVAKFAQNLEVDYPMLSDPTRTVAKAYGVVHDDQSFATRWTFYIGANGRILYVDEQVSPASAGEAVARRLATLGIPRRSSVRGRQ